MGRRRGACLSQLAALAHTPRSAPNRQTRPLGSVGSASSIHSCRRLSPKEEGRAQSLLDPWRVTCPEWRVNNAGGWKWSVKCAHCPWRVATRAGSGGGLTNHAEDACKNIPSAPLTLLGCPTCGLQNEYTVPNGVRWLSTHRAQRRSVVVCPAPSRHGYSLFFCSCARPTAVVNCTTHAGQTGRLPATAERGAASPPGRPPWTRRPTATRHGDGRQGVDPLPSKSTNRKRKLLATRNSSVPMVLL